MFFAKANAVGAVISVLASMHVAGGARAEGSSDHSDVVAEDAAAFFGGLCIATRGEKARVSEAIDRQMLLALPLNAEGVAEYLNGKPGDSGWVIRTGREAVLPLHLETPPDLDTPATCRMRASHVDDETLQSRVLSVLEALAARDEFSYEKVLDNRRATRAGVEHLVGYRLMWRKDGWTANFAVSHIGGKGDRSKPQAQLTVIVRQRPVS